MAVAFGFAVAALGPAMPLLRDDLGISRTTGGLHFTALATGAVIAGFVVARATRLWGRRRIFWLGGIGVASGCLLIAVGWSAAVTLPGALLVGAAGSASLVSAQAMLSDCHPQHRPIVLTEINTAMSTGSVLPALLIGGMVGIGLGWRPAFVAPMACVVALALGFRPETFPDALDAGTTERDAQLPRAYWLYWAAFIPAVGAEWSVGAWGADYLVDVAGTSEGTAAFLMTAFFGAMLGGRLAGGRIAQSVAPYPLLGGATAIALIGVLIFWGSTAPLPVVVGLLVVGLGASMQFPMIMSLAIGAASHRPDAAAARVSIAAGSSVIVAPLTLGAVADQTSIRAAFSLVPWLFMLVIVLVTLGMRAARQTSSESAG